MLFRNQLFLQGSRRDGLLQYCDEPLLFCCFEYLERRGGEGIYATCVAKSVSRHEATKFLANPQIHFASLLRISGQRLPHIVLKTQQWV